MHGTGLLEQLENFCEKRLYIFKSFRPLTENFWTSRGKISEALSKRNCTPPVQPFWEFFLKIYKFIKFLELARIFGIWAESIQQDAWTKFYVIRETICRRIFENMVFLNCSFLWAKNSCPISRIFLTALSKLNFTWPPKKIEDFFTGDILLSQCFFLASEQKISRLLAEGFYQSFWAWKNSL